MKILCIGNSFSQDATRYLSEIALSNGEDFKVINLFIGSCSLEMHYNNIIENADKYNVQERAQFSSEYISIEKALKSDDWDVVTVQQASALSFNYATYQPYLDFLIKTIKQHAKNAKIYVHQTWAYHDNSEKLEVYNFSSSKEMFDKLKISYDKAFSDIKADGIIPSGELILKLNESGVKKTHRDGLHLSLGIGRYAVGLLWYNKLSGKSVDNIKLNEYDEEILEKDIEIAKQIIKTL